MKNHLMWPVATGLTIALLGYAARKGISSVYGEADAVRLIDSLSSAGLYPGSAIVTASATILALMLTLLGLTKRVDRNFDFAASTRIQIISTLAAATLLRSLLFLLLRSRFLITASLYCIMFSMRQISELPRLLRVQS